MKLKSRTDWSGHYIPLRALKYIALNSKCGEYRWACCLRDRAWMQAYVAGNDKIQRMPTANDKQ